MLDAIVKVIEFESKRLELFLFSNWRRESNDKHIIVQVSKI